MATRNIVPHADGEGNLGLSIKRWLGGYFSGTLQLNGVMVATLNDLSSAVPVAGIAYPRFLPAVNSTTGGAANNLDSITTVGLTAGHRVQYIDPALGGQNYYLVAGTAPSGAPDYVTPVDHATSGFYWAKY